MKSETPQEHVCTPCAVEHTPDYDYDKPHCADHYCAKVPPETSERERHESDLPSVMQVVMGKVSGYDIRHITPTCDEFLCLPEKNPHHYGVRTKVVGEQSQTEATPRPWRNEGQVLTDDFAIVVGDETYNWRFVAHVSTDDEDNDTNATPPIRAAEARANAELIVRAVNSYDTQAAQIATLKAEIEVARKEGEQWADAHDARYKEVEALREEVAALEKALRGCVEQMKLVPSDTVPEVSDCVFDTALAAARAALGEESPSPEGEK